MTHPGLDPEVLADQRARIVVPVELARRVWYSRPRRLFSFEPDANRLGGAS